jgi:hypothetical protein
MIGIVRPLAAPARHGGDGFVQFCDELCVC